MSGEGGGVGGAPVRRVAMLLTEPTVCVWKFFGEDSRPAARPERPERPGVTIPTNYGWQNDHFASLQVDLFAA